MIAADFQALSAKKISRDQLRKVWQYYSTESKKKKANHTRSLHKTGSGPFEQHLEPIDEMIIDANGGDDKEIPNNYDSETVLAKVQRPDPLEFALKLNGITGTSSKLAEKVQNVDEGTADEDGDVDVEGEEEEVEEEHEEGG